MKIWIQEHESCAAGRVAAFRAALGGEPVQWVAPGSEPGALGVILFQQAGVDLGAWVHEMSRGGLDRLVAIALDQERICGATAWPLRRAGASDVLAGADVEAAVAALLSRARRWAQIAEMMRAAPVAEALVGLSPAWVRVLREIVETAAFTDASVLLLGESGTGKELIARLIHDLDRRPGKRNLVVLDCTTVVPELSGSEFFGHERGAFTGAAIARDGCFSIADGGTLFLDEIGELPLPLQAQLLRVVQEHTYKRVGSNEWKRASFRLVAATNRALDADTEGGTFRRDLFHRIACRVFHIPPLRERSEDVLPLAAHFFAQLRPGRPIVFDGAVREYLLGRAYPGNIRELRQLICRMSDRWVGEGPVTVGTIPLDEMPAEAGARDWHRAALDSVIWKALELGVGLHEIKDAAARRAFALALEMEAGSTRAAAQRLAVTERTVQTYRAEVRLAANQPSDGREATAHDAKTN